MTSVAHELQHTDEALSDSAITTNSALFLVQEHVEDKQVVSLNVGYFGQATPELGRRKLV